MFFEALILGTCTFFLWSINPVHSVLSLVLVGLGFSALLLGKGLEFGALVVVLVYVGAVTVLFIFVVMMVNLRATSENFTTSESLGVWFFLVVLLGWAGGWSSMFWENEPYYLLQNYHREGSALVTPLLEKYNNLLNLGFLFYGTTWVYTVFLISLVLLVAMIAAICLSLVTGENYRTQEFYSQIRRPNAVFNFKSVSKK